MLKLSRLLNGQCLQQSPIRKIMEMADRKNLVKLGLRPEEIISFAGGWANHKAPEELRKEYLNIAKDKDFFHKIGGYSPSEGDFELRMTLARMEQELYGVNNLSTDNIIVGQSSTQLLFGLLLTLLNPQDKILLFDPTYANYFEQIHVCQRKERIITLKVFNQDSWRFMANEAKILSSLKRILKKERPKAILFSSPDNPTGQIFSDRFVEKMLRLALHFETFVLIDNSYRDQYYTKKRPRQFSFSPEDYNNLITIHSNSKWCRGLGRRMGWLKANREVVNALKKIQQTTILCPDTMHQVAMTNYIKRGLKNGALQRYLKENRKRYRRAAEFTSQCIKKYLGMRYLKPQGGLYTVVDVGKDSDTFVQEVLKNTGVVFVPGSGFGQTLQKGIRVSFGPLVDDLAKIKEGFLRVRKFLAEAKLG